MTAKDIEAKLKPVRERISALSETQKSIEEQAAAVTRDRATLVRDGGAPKEIEAHTNSLRVHQDRLSGITDGIAMLEQQRDELQLQFQAATEIERRNSALTEIDTAKTAALAARTAMTDAIERFVVDTLPPLVSATEEAVAAGIRTVERAQNGPLPDAPHFPVAPYVDGRIANIARVLIQAAAGLRAVPPVRA